MSLLTDVKDVLRISTSVANFDTEINDLIDYAQDDLVVAGVLQSKIDAFVANPDSDKIIKSAVKTYVKANFGWNNPDKEDFQNSYDMQKMRMTLTQQYTVEVV